MTHNPDYFCKYENLHMERTPSGVLTLRFHTNGGPITFTGTTHHDLPRALAEIGDDRANKVLVIISTLHPRCWRGLKKGRGRAVGVQFGGPCGDRDRRGQPAARHA